MNQTKTNIPETAKAEANLRTAIACIKLGGISKQDIAYATDIPLITIEELFRKHSPEKPSATKG
ncbi:MAG: hypothetical protein NC299_16815 [Lachnospiraceae bacterium]|nr:hypothetical protein [Ruminococcus sp.]MCM1276997.1 hypothetical protein [Lachnospiraceae bacterium]